MLSSRDIRSDILIPRYYDPRIEDDLRSLDESHEVVTLDDMVSRKQLRHDHGSYVPKIYYGTGPYPYIRTSDLANWELKASPKHGLSHEVYEDYRVKQDV